MDQIVAEYIDQRATQGSEHFRFAATPRVTLQKPDGSHFEVPFQPCLGATAEEAAEKAVRALNHWKKQWKQRG